MDSKSAAAIILLILLLGITAYLKKERISDAGIMERIRGIVESGIDAGLMDGGRQGNVSVRFSGEGRISGKGMIKGIAVFYFPERTRIGEKVEAEKWVTMNISAAKFTIDDGISIRGEANRIELENGVVEGPFSVDFTAEFFSANISGDIAVNGSSGRLEASSLDIAPQYFSIRSFSGKLDWLWNKSMEGRAWKVVATEDGIRYEVSG